MSSYDGLGYQFSELSAVNDYLSNSTSQLLNRMDIIDEKPTNYSEKNFKNNYSYDTKNELPYEKDIHPADGQSIETLETLPGTCKIELDFTDFQEEKSDSNEVKSNLNEEKLDLNVGIITFKANSIHSIGESFFKDESSSLIAVKALSDVGSQTSLGKKTKRNAGKTKNSDQLKIKKSVSEASAIRKETSTNLTYNQGFETIEIEEKTACYPVWEILDSSRTLTEGSLQNYYIFDPDETITEDDDPKTLSRFKECSDLNSKKSEEKKKVFEIHKCRKQFCLMCRYDLILRKIRTDCLKCLSNFVCLKNIFPKETKEARTDEQKLFNKKTIQEIIREALDEIEIKLFSDWDEFNARSLEESQKKFKKMNKKILEFNFEDFYNQYYLEGGLYKKKFNSIKQKFENSPTYIRLYTHYLENYVDHYANAKGNKMDEENQNKKGRRIMKKTTSKN